MRGPKGKVVDIVGDGTRAAVAVPALYKGELINGRFATATMLIRAVIMGAAFLNRQPSEDQQASTIGTVGAALLAGTLGVEAIDGVMRERGTDRDHPMDRVRTTMEVVTTAVGVVAAVGYCVDTVRSWRDPADMVQ